MVLTRHPNTSQMMMNELLNTGALGGLHVDGRDTRFRYRMRTAQPPAGGPSAGSAGGAGVPRHRCAALLCNLGALTAPRVLTAPRAPVSYSNHPGRVHVLLFIGMF